MLALRAIAILGLSVVTLAAQAPFPGLQSNPTRAKAAVAYLFPEQVTVTAGKPTAVDLHFRVADGLHVNSHTPHTEDLIPTTLKLANASGVQLAKVDYPAGKDFAFDIDPKEKLNVYTGEFIVHAELVAAKGDHLVEATLRYQACDNSTCMPPRSIPVAIDVIAK